MAEASVGVTKEASDIGCHVRVRINITEYVVGKIGWRQDAGQVMSEMRKLQRGIWRLEAGEIISVILSQHCSGKGWRLEAG